MQLALSFSVLLGSLLIALTQVSALPVDGNAGIVTLPLKRVHGPRSDVHPLVLLQQHINRSNRRLARLSGREAPSDEELSHALRKRILSVEASSGLEARYNRQGAKVTPAPAKAAVNKVVNAAVGRKGKGGKGKGTAAADVGGAQHDRRVDEDCTQFRA
ncbi:hypothetical protein EWM64_g4301 [Hericium alpestre]|uniref:Uncharacterized protein n=1 Tax=Hericium alpestre TaxID=135208 RepID=A0A4Y9ZZV9_9AGAM|nr:hypothetical protein EWM64_g4301 [Hericium alpestre]